MKRKFLYLNVLYILVFVKTAFAQQDAQFSQYMFNGLYINPAYAGYKEQLNLHTFYRNQWTGFPGAPKTMSLSVDAPMMLYNMGLGLQISNDKVGIENSLSVYGIYSYRLQINDEARLSFGLGAGFINNSLDGTNSITNDQGDELQPGVKSSALTPDVKFGAFYNDERFYIGASATNLLSPYMVYSADEDRIIPKRSPHIYLTSGGLVDISDNVKLKPSFLFKQEIKGISSLDLNLFVLLHDKIWLGTSYRSGLNLFKNESKNTTFGSNSVVFLSEFYLSEQFRIGYAYDFSLNALQGLNSGSHEISLGYTMDVSNILGNTYHSHSSRGSIKVSREKTEKVITPKDPVKPKEITKETPKPVQPAPVRDNSEAEAREKKTAEELKAKQAAEELKAKQAAEEVKAKQAAEELKAKQAAEEVKAKQAAEEVKAKQVAEELKAQQAAEELKAKQAAEEVKAKQVAEELKAKQAAEELKAKQAAEELEAQKAAAEAKAKEKQNAAEAKAAERAQREREKAEAMEQREREKEEALKLEREKREKAQEAAAAKAKADAEAEVAKVRAREEADKSKKVQEPKSDYEKEQEKARDKAEKEAKKLRRKNGAMVSPRYF